MHEILALMKIEHGMWNKLNHAVNLITGMVIQQEVTESHSKLEVSSIQKVRERKSEDKNFKKTMLQKSKN